jgi:hypothetical protein
MQDHANSKSPDIRRHERILKEADRVECPVVGRGVFGIGTAFRSHGILPWHERGAAHLLQPTLQSSAPFIRKPAGGHGGPSVIAASSVYRSLVPAANGVPVPSNEFSSIVGGRDGC